MQLSKKNYGWFHPRPSRGWSWYLLYICSIISIVFFHERYFFASRLRTRFAAHTSDNSDHLLLMMAPPPHAIPSLSASVEVKCTPSRIELLHELLNRVRAAVSDGLCARREQ